MMGLTLAGPHNAPDAEAASHFVYPIRHNSFNRKTVFIISLLSDAIRSHQRCPSMDNGSLPT